MRFHQKTIIVTGAGSGIGAAAAQRFLSEGANVSSEKQVIRMIAKTIKIFGALDVLVNTASVSGLGGDDDMIAYNTSKGAVCNCTRSMAIDHARDGVRVHAVCPSLTMTDLTKGMAKDKKTMRAFMNRIPLARAAEPEDIAGAIAFPASDDARFITGVNLPVDGGVTASNGQPIYYQ